GFAGAARLTARVVSPPRPPERVRKSPSPKAAPSRRRIRANPPARLIGRALIIRGGQSDSEEAAQRDSGARCSDRECDADQDQGRQREAERVHVLLAEGRAAALDDGQGELLRKDEEN